MDLPLGTARDAGLVLALSAVDSFFTVRYFSYEIMGAYTSPNPILGAFHFLISLALTVSAITCYRAYQKQPDPTHPLVPMAVSNYSDSVAEWAPMIGYASCLWSFVTVHLQTRLVSAVGSVKLERRSLLADINIDLALAGTGPATLGLLGDI
ncbi:hypothetical protein AX16_009003 [Volvariella volvacea WC 439]|nr:hypothetical protein AX16_009003 [Volvariella volvacea WC 439]